VPWFVGLFGRDSLLPTLQCLAFNLDLGARTAHALAHWQGKKDDEKTREQPGKILHELRVGELAHLHEVPQTPSYAAVDSTPLFLIAIARHVGWTGDMALFRELRSNIDAALSWLRRKLDEGGGYVTYSGLAGGRQPVNQSWRDSGTGVLRADGSYPVPPLALVEVQGYAFQAMTLTACLLRRFGEAGHADRLEAMAADLQQRFASDFWMEAEGCYCLALEQGGKQVASVASNAAQVLWTGIASPGHAARIAARVMQPDMFSGWGVRTLSSGHATFDPLAYQQGSVWPFDNSLIVSGLRRYGEDAAALRIQRARNVIVAGYAVESPRLLLNSATDRYPDGLANSSGLVGKNLMTQSNQAVWGRMEQEVRWNKGPPSLAITEHWNYDDKKDFFGGYCWMGQGPLPIEWAAVQTGSRGLWGQALHDAMLHYNRMIGVKMVGEMLPDEANRVTLADDRDQYGLRVAQITYKWGDNDKALIQHALEQMGRSIEAIGAHDMFRQEDDTNHLGGTARMGDDPARSVVNADCRSWDIPNLWVCDGSVFPTVGGVNPALTIQTIAMRTASRIGIVAKRGEL